MLKFLSPLVLLCCLSLPPVTVSAQNPPGPDFDPEHQRTVRLVTPDLSAEVIARPLPPPATGLIRSIILKTKTGEALIPLSFEFNQVNAVVEGPPGKLVITGMATGSVYVIGILEVAAGKVVDTFRCYEPSISPNGYYVAFTKFFGPHTALSPDFHNMVYNVARSPSENRPPGIRRENNVDVGFALYPPGIGNSTDDNSDVSPESAHTFGGGYFWRDSQYFFVDRTVRKVQVVWVTIANETAMVHGAAISPSQLGLGHYDVLPRLADVDLEDAKVKFTIYSGVTRPLVVSLADFVSLGSVDLRGQPSGLRAADIF